MSGPQPPLLRVRPAPAPPSPQQQRAASTDSPNVLSRLHALFTPSSPIDPPSEDGGMFRCKTTSAVPDVPLPSPGTFVDRDAIKVLVVTWNMGDALPKGDLSVLFGDVPAYAVPEGASTGFPQLPVENKHPYHIIVVAGQECPTDSGVPRGLGGGIMKGVHVRSAHRREKEERKKEKEKDKEDESSAPDNMKEDVTRSPGMETDEEDESRGPSPTPLPNTPVLHKHHHPSGTKGWSTMLDDWFCGPPSIHDKVVVPSVYPSPKNSPSQLEAVPAPSPFPAPSLAKPMPPGLLRSSSAPVGMSPTEPLHIPQSTLAAPAFIHSPLARSASSSASSSSASSQEGPAFPHTPYQGADVPGPKSSSLPIKRDRPAIIIPNDEPERTRDGGKCYLHLVKERLMGMYLSVYVYKGCEHLIQGVDKDFVTAGLAGGRVGNKGGIGISLKLADRRFLFVNSHLAAHSSRVSARLSNIAKIKSELRLDTFLPKDDPRNSLEDLTDRFDSVFWCGDLNFRLELSRLHAEWLVEQKKYPEALMWDQLKNAMKDPEKNPFPGFEEGIIDFPPTFKYDVWRSIKSTNRELKRSLRRRGTLEGRLAQRPSAADLSPALSQNLSHVPEAEAHEELNEENEDREDGRNSDEDTRTIASRRSFESTNGFTSAGPSTAGTDAEDDEFATSVDASAYGSRHRAFEAAIKAKTKTWLSLVKMDKVLTPSPSSRRILGRSGSKKIKEKKSQEFDYESRRTSISSIASLEPPGARGENFGARTSMSSVRPLDPSAPPRRPSDASFLSSSPNQPMRRFSMLKRSMSGRSSTQDGRSGDSHELCAEDIDESMDIREGVYDTSKKQRVPSWCDRVLWKSQITPDARPDLPSPSTEDDHHERGSRALNRISHAFANFGGHLRLSMTRTGSNEPHDRPNLHLNSPLLNHEGTERMFVASPEPSPALQPESSPPKTERIVPSPQRPSPISSPIRSRLTGRTRSGSATHPLLDAEMVSASSPAFPKITFDPALPADGDRSGLVLRPRANSDSVPATAGVGIVQRSLSTASNAHVTPPRINARQSSGGSLKIKSVKTTDAVNPTFPRSHQPQSTSATQIFPSHAEDRNSFVKFIKDLPALLHVRSHHTEPASIPLRPELDFDRPKRHLNGEVKCLHYGTIDDAGMRLLEGRSDHRPAIFAAAVYVGD